MKPRSLVVDLFVFLLLVLTMLFSGPVLVRAADPAQGWASTWAGPGAATHDCRWPWTDCQIRAVQSLDTGVVIIVTPTMYCRCVVPDSPHPRRLVDLDPAMVAALGLEAADGLWRVEVIPVDGTTGLPDTSMQP
jgi:hypothetical protein